MGTRRNAAAERRQALRDRWVSAFDLRPVVGHTAGEKPEWGPSEPHHQPPALFHMCGILQGITELRPYLNDPDNEIYREKSINPKPFMKQSTN